MAINQIRSIGVFIDGGYYAKIESEITDKESVSAVREDITKTFQVLGESKFINSTYFEMKSLKISPLCCGVGLFFYPLGGSPSGSPSSFFDLISYRFPFTGER